MLCCCTIVCLVVFSVFAIVLLFYFVNVPLVSFTILVSYRQFECENLVKETRLFPM